MGALKNARTIFDICVAGAMPGIDASLGPERGSLHPEAGVDGRPGEDVHFDVATSVII